MQNKGKFIVFEGLDGSGKSTQAKLLSEYLTQNNIKNVLTCEPTDSNIGKMIRQMLSGKEKIDSKTAALLFAADRIEHITAENGMLELVNNGITVISDRYYFSSYAYQMADMPLDFVMKINSMAHDMLKPDINIFIDLSPEDCMQRILKNRESTDIFETSERLTRVRNNFFEIFKRVEGDENVAVINGNDDIDTVFKNVLCKIEEIIK